MSRNLPPGEGETARTACAPGLLRTAVEEETGETLSPAALADRVGWAVGLVSGMACEVMAAHWNATDVDALASGVDAGGRALPSNAWMALRRLGWAALPPVGVRVNDRIVRMAQESAGRALRLAGWRAGVIAGILATWPASPAGRTAEEWDAVREAVPGGRHLPSSVISSRTRQAAAFERKHGRLPADVFELEPAPPMALVLPLSACDRQQATMERHDGDPGRALLRLQLPTRADPGSYRDWTWVACPVTLPPTIPANAVLHLPALRVKGGKVRADLAYTHPVPKPARSGHTVALGVDWGLNTLLSAGAARLHADGTITALGAGAQYRANGVLAKQHRLRRQGERLHAKADQYQRLTDGGGRPLTARRQVLAEEARRVAERRSNLNDALAGSAARRAVDQAIAAGATVIYVEDLRSMEARGMGRTMNTRLSQTVRGQIVDRVRHTAAEAGIAVVAVPARNTSRHCPRCLAPVKHRKAPDRPAAPGWKWAVCGSCGWQGDRDQGAWQRIVARGLAHQAATVTDRGSGALLIRAVDDVTEQRAVLTAQVSGRDRSKTGPTARRSTSRRVPRRRAAPSPPPPQGCGGQRPEGRAHTVRPRLPRAASRNQGATTIRAPAGRHRPRGAALGAGFHLHAHATPPRWAEPLLDITSRKGSLS